MAIAQDVMLGAEEEVYRRWRPVRTWVCWMVALAVMIVAAVIGMMAGQHVIAVALIVLFPVVLAAYRYVAAREFVVLHEHGLTYQRGAAVQVVRWEEVGHVWQRPRAVTLRLDSDITLTGFARQAELAAAIDAGVQPYALARARAQLRETWQAHFPPLTINRARLKVDRDGNEESVSWPQIDSYEHMGGRLVIYLNRAGNTTPWFDDVVADVVAAERLMNETDPTTLPVDAARLVAADLTAESAEGRQRTCAARGSRVLQGAVMVVLLAGAGVYGGVTGSGAAQPYQPDVSLAPYSGLGLPDVCSGIAAQRAAAPYSGAMHPVDFEGDSGFTSSNLNVSDQLGVLTGPKGVNAEPQAWVPSTASDAQLVACVVTQPGTEPLTSCHYLGEVAGTLYRQQYTITLYNAQSGRAVAGPMTLQGDDTTCPKGVLAGDGESLNLYASLSESQVEQAIGKYVQQPGSVHSKRAMSSGGSVRASTSQ